MILFDTLMSGAFITSLNVVSHSTIFSSTFQLNSTGQLNVAVHHSWTSVDTFKFVIHHSSADIHANCVSHTISSIQAFLIWAHSHSKRFVFSSVWTLTVQNSGITSTKSVSQVILFIHAVSMFATSASTSWASKVQVNSAFKNVGFQVKFVSHVILSMHASQICALSHSRVFTVAVFHTVKFSWIVTLSFIVGLK